MPSSPHQRTLLDKFLGRNKLNNKPAARELLEAELLKRRHLTYSELLKRLEHKDVESYEINDKSGIPYQLEFTAVWDDKRLRTIRFVGSITGGDISAYSPLSTDFIKNVDNNFVGE